MLIKFTKCILNISALNRPIAQWRQCHSVFGIKKLIETEKLPEQDFELHRITPDLYQPAVDMIKRDFLPLHVLCQYKKMDLSNDRSLDEYIVRLLKQGNSMCALQQDGSLAAVSVNYASSRCDPDNLRQYAYYRQDPNTKDFFYFLAKLQETPNLWTMFNQQKIFEMKMLCVSPGCRRRGLATRLARRAREAATDQGYCVLRLDCLNKYDYKLAERLMMRCISRYPLHRLRGAAAPFVKKSSELNRVVRVYVEGSECREVAETIEMVRKKAPESLIE
ncbi:hypothetical protein JYU34_021029 [Plutella xylostella]|uniref:N-acetyltransferase domain-containing protein n=1 Tax=Plutella xylostella TaxID=51655 RepID=A0ABQ7PSI5_PLUXY|nr:hypothetical protein JYU34_021029 [Plutella xylostella]